MPLLTAVIGVLIGTTALTALTGVINVSETAPILATMLGLAVGIDYALFILSRHRQNLAEGTSRARPRPWRSRPRVARSCSPARPWSSPWSACWSSNIPFLTVMGLAAAGTVAIAVLIALTLLPGAARLRRDADGAQSNRVLTHALEALSERKGEKMGARWVKFVTRRPLAVLAIGLVGLCAVALPALDLRLGLPDGGSHPKGDTERESYDLLTEGFGPGFNGTLTGVVDAPDLSAAERERDRQADARRRLGVPRASPRSARRSRTRPASSPSSR